MKGNQLLVKSRPYLTAYKFLGVLWLDASSYDIAEQAYVDMASAFGCKETSKDVKQSLTNTTNSRLLGIDNADDPDLKVRDLLSSGNRGTVLIITRLPEYRQLATAGSTKVDILDDQEAIEFLLKASLLINSPDDTNGEITKRVVEKLGDLALAINQVAAYIRYVKCTLNDDVEEFSRDRAEILKVDNLSLFYAVIGHVQEAIAIGDGLIIISFDTQSYRSCKRWPSKTSNEITDAFTDGTEKDMPTKCPDLLE